MAQMPRNIPLKIQRQKSPIAVKTTTEPMICTVSGAGRIPITDPMLQMSSPIQIIDMIVSTIIFLPAFNVP